MESNDWGVVGLNLWFILVALLMWGATLRPERINEERRHQGLPPQSPRSMRIIATLATIMAAAFCVLTVVSIIR